MSVTDLRPSERRRDERTIGELFGELSRDTSRLMRQEMELARIELKEEAAKVGKAAGILGATAFCAYMGALMLSFALAWGLAEVMAPGWAFLIVAALFAAAAGALYAKGPGGASPRSSQT